MEQKITDLVSIRGDEYYTYQKNVIEIAQRLIKGIKIWCPFDDENSQFPKVLRRYGFDVVNTHSDFFITDPPKGCDAIVSNPPFSKKKDVLKRCNQLGIRFALILPFLMINDGTPFDYGKQIILYRKRMKFLTPQGVANKPRTNCFVLSNGLLIKDFQIVY